MIQPSEAHELCSKSEWALVESSFSPMVETLSPSGLESRIDRASKLHRKSIELINVQHSDSRKRTTRRKAELFAEVIGRFESSLKLSEKSNSAQPSHNAEKQQVTEKTRTFNRDALRDRSNREFQSRKNEVLSAVTVRSEQNKGISGEKRIQSHVGSVTRRRQAKRDMKNR
jgi:hypothetical protein